jgi:tRNA (cmo5U34)-methyltransferase
LLTVEILSRVLRPRERVYDLGCSTGSALVQIGTTLKHLDLRLVGLDTSLPMVEKARLKTRAFGLGDAVIEIADVTHHPLEAAGACVMNYTLQFIPTQLRGPFLKRIHAALRPGGVLLLAEKIRADESSLQDLVNDVYYAFKRGNGYSELEISQKREALEDVLVPLGAREQTTLLHEAGFQEVETVLRWGPFATFLAVKR